MSRVTFILLLSLFGLPIAALAYLGAEQCANCHPAQYDYWLTTPHARATARLSLDERRDPRCNGCHATSSTNGFLGVQCESCHGPGDRYWPSNIMSERAVAQRLGLKLGTEPNVCTRCHTVDSPRLKPFNVAELLQRVCRMGGQVESK